MMPGLFLVKCWGSVSSWGSGAETNLRQTTQSELCTAHLLSCSKLGRTVGRGKDPDAVALPVPPAAACCPPNHDCFMCFFFPSVKKMGCGVNYWEKYTKS